MVQKNSLTPNSTYLRRLADYWENKDTTVTMRSLSLSHFELIPLYSSPKKSSRCLYPGQRQNAFFQRAGNQNWLPKHTIPLPQSLWHGKPFPASTVILDPGRRKPAKSEMCHEATGWEARIPKQTQARATGKSFRRFPLASVAADHSQPKDNPSIYEGSLLNSSFNTTSHLRSISFQSLLLSTLSCQACPTMASPVRRWKSRRQWKESQRGADSS